MCPYLHDVFVTLNEVKGTVSSMAPFAALRVTLLLTSSSPSWPPHFSLRAHPGLRIALTAAFASASPRPSDPVPAHDLEQAGVIGEAERLGGTRDVPVVPLEGGHDDLPLRLRLELLESLEV